MRPGVSRNRHPGATSRLSGCKQTVSRTPTSIRVPRRHLLDWAGTRCDVGCEIGAGAHGLQWLG